MEFGSFYGGDHAKYNGVRFVVKSKILDEAALMCFKHHMAEFNYIAPLAVGHSHDSRK